MDFFTMLPLLFHRYFIVSLLIVLSLMSIVDLIVDGAEGVGWVHMAEEGFILLLCLVGVGHLLMSLRRQNKSIASLKADLADAEAKAELASQTLREARQVFGKVIVEQFETWKLSKSEQEVGLLLLKGLSLAEIAVVRETQEKTVRQQASAIYKKAGVAGRHAFAAWFFEDYVQLQMPA